MKMEQVWVSADQHFRHGNILKYCSRIQFMSESEKATFQDLKSKGLLEDRTSVKALKMSLDSIKRMDEALIDHTNELVAPRDQLYWMGDIIFCKDIDPKYRLDKLKEYRNKIKCKNIHMIIGNHDYFKMNELREVFSSVQYYKELKIQHQKFILFHYPILEWNGKFHGSICLHGHCHTNKEAWKKEHMPNSWLFDIGVDAWDYKPVNLKTIYDKCHNGTHNE